jgi:transposase
LLTTQWKRKEAITMLKVDEWMDVHLLKKQGYSRRQIAKLTGHGRNTVKKMLEMEAEQAQTRTYKKRASKLDEFKPYLKARYEEFGLSAVRLKEEIRPMGYSGSIDLVQRYLKTLKPLKVAVEKATVRFETPPGEQAQADWAYCGRFLDPNGETVPIYAFIIVLGFSRLMYVEFTTSMELPALLECHKNAFAFFGGVPLSILYDNMKQVRLGPGQFHPLFLDFALHYGFVPKTHRVRRPRTKGKVERMVDYLKDNFLNGRTFVDLADLNAQGQPWLSHTANVRIHSTTLQRPVDLWAVELPKLNAFSKIAPYQLAQIETRKVSTESFVSFQGSRYSVPPSLVGQTVLVELRSGEHKVLIRSNNMIVAEHPLSTKKGASLVTPAHLEALWKLSLASPAPPPSAHYQLSFAQSVESRPLTVYEEVGR